MKIKAALHAHSTWSYDGKWTLERLAKSFAARGYRALLMTEHDQGFTEDRRRAYWEACKNASTENILIVPGIEYSDPSNVVHMLVWGELPFLGAGVETQRMLEMVADGGGIAVFAHPSRRDAWRRFKAEWTKLLVGIEYWNQKTDGWSPSSDAGKLIENSGASPMVGLDFHSRKQFFPMSTIVTIEGKLDHNNILEELRLGKFHCEVFGAELASFKGSVVGPALTTLEFFRRTAARTYRFAFKRS